MSRYPEMPDFLDEIVRERSAGNPAFARLVDAASRRRAVIRQLAARRALLDSPRPPSLRA